MTKAEYDLWRSSPSGYGHYPVGDYSRCPCFDCQLAFALEMSWEGRCDGRPADDP